MDDAGRQTRRGQCPSGQHRAFRSTTERPASNGPSTRSSARTSTTSRSSSATTHRRTPRRRSAPPTRHATTRIQLHRNPTNVGLVANFNRTFELSRGTYFQWAAHDDWHAPDTLRTTVGLLERNPAAVACGSAVSIVDEQGRPLGVWHPTVDLDVADARQRFHRLIFMLGWPHLLFGTTAVECPRSHPPHAELPGVRPGIARRAQPARPDPAHAEDPALLHPGVDRCTPRLPTLGPLLVRQPRQAPPAHVRDSSSSISRSCTARNWGRSTERRWPPACSAGSGSATSGASPQSSITARSSLGARAVRRQ